MQKHDTDSRYESTVMDPFEAVLDEDPSRAPEPQPYHCSSEYHLSRLAPSASYIYPFALRISKSSNGIFYCSATNLSEYFGCNEKTIRRGFDALAEVGFFKILDRHLYSSTVYQVLTHTEWAEGHPGQCVEKLEYVWSGQGDPLGQYIYTRMGGRFALKEFQIKLIRNRCRDDAHAKELFEEFYAGRLSKSHPSRIIPAFITWLKATSGETTNVDGQICPAITVQSCPAIH